MRALESLVCTVLSREASHRRGPDFDADYDKISRRCQRPIVRRNRNRSGVLTVAREGSMRPTTSEEVCPMSSFRIAMLFGALAIASVAADAQTPGRVRGTITAIDGNTLSVKSREGQDLKIELAPNATFAYMKALKLSDIAPVAFGASSILRSWPSRDFRSEEHTS